ncbi:MAG: hypothetical protein EBX65_08800, partial [Betaproteobacteria bacterium]|nr:hypothetical protein [Betaproteobacteria bacterium]
SRIGGESLRALRVMPDANMQAFIPKAGQAYQEAAQEPAPPAAALPLESAASADTDAASKGPQKLAAARATVTR